MYDFECEKNISPFVNVLKLVAKRISYCPRYIFESQKIKATR